MPLRFADGTKLQILDDAREQSLERREVAQAFGRAAVRLDDPFDPVHLRTRYDCAVPHSGQNFAALGIGLPQFVQNFVAPAADAVPPGAADVPALVPLLPP